MNYFFLTLLFLTNFLFGGFAKNTLVLSPDEFAEISSLQKGEYVCSEGCSSKILATRSLKLSNQILISFDNEQIICAPDQLFYVPKLEKWVLAENLKIDYQLIDYDGNYVEILDIKQLDIKQNLYEIALAKSHTYFVSSKKILVHNFAVTIGLSWAFGGGAVKFAGATLCGVLGGILGVKVAKDLTTGRNQSWQTQIQIEQDKLKHVLLQETNSKEKPKPKLKVPDKTFEDIEKEACPGDKTKGKSTIHIKPDGTHNDALEDFDSLKPEDVKTEGDKKIGRLSDGRIVNVRIDSKDGRPTLEVYDGRKSRKIRYGLK